MAFLKRFTAPFLVAAVLSACGVLGARTVTMGGATYFDPSVKVLDVTVAKDPRTGRMTARIDNQL